MACPNCAKDSVERYRPFCSRRCADVDLANWLSGSYAIPASEDTHDAAAPVWTTDGRASADDSLN